MKKIIICGLTLTHIGFALGMATGHVIHQDDTGFQILLNPTTDTWCPKIPGHAYLFNSDQSAVITKLAGRDEYHAFFAVADVRSGNLLNEWVLCDLQSPDFVGFSPHGHLAYFTPNHRRWTLVINVKNGKLVALAGDNFSFSPDLEESRIVLHLAQKDGTIQVLINTFNWFGINRIHGNPVYICPCAPIMLVGTKNSDQHNDDICLNPLVMDMITGKKIGQLRGHSPRFYPNQPIVFLSENGSTNRTIVYSLLDAQEIGAAKDIHEEGNTSPK